MAYYTILIDNGPGSTPQSQKMYYGQMTRQEAERKFSLATELYPGKRIMLFQGKTLGKLIKIKNTT